MTKLNDLTGQRFGRLVIIEKAEKPASLKKKDSYWLCKCDCGNEKIISGNHLKRGSTKSCGCYRLSMIITGRPAKDLSGKKFGKLTVIKRVDTPEGIKDTHTFWLCECKCGTQKILRSTDFVWGGTKSCGCYVKEVSRYNFKDLSGEKFGKLTVIKRVSAPEKVKRKIPYWLCKCECGGEIVSSTSNLSRKGISCKYCAREKISKANLKDLTGQKFGKLLVIKRGISLEHIKSRTTYWLCKCDCGNEKNIRACNLKHGIATSCGCSNPPRINFEDLTGQKFGKLIVIKRIDSENTFKEAKILCKCDCGKEHIVSRANLIKTKGGIRSCGCSKSEFISLAQTEDLTGRKNYNLTAIKQAEAPEGKRKCIYWLCRCDCGKEYIIAATNFKKRKQNSCECHYKETALNSLYKIYISQAKIRDLKFELTKDEFTRLTKQNCYYCGSHPSMKFNKLYVYNGVDRIDSSKGYTSNNVVPACKICNRTKSNMVYEDFVFWIERIYKYSNLKELKT